MPSKLSAKKAVNVSISASLVEAARTENINLSATLESAIEAELRRRQRAQWLTFNAEGIDAYNRDVEENGVFGDNTRSF